MATEIKTETDIDRFLQSQPDRGKADTVDVLSFMHNDQGNADRLVALHGENLRYCHARRTWLVWDSKRWIVDDTEHAKILAKSANIACMQKAVGVGDRQSERFAKESLEHRRVCHMLAAAQPHLAIRAHELDQDPYALNVLNGTVDLRTGELRGHRRDEFITKLVHHNYNPDATCPRWQEFLCETMGGKSRSTVIQNRARRVLPYLQRAFGYSITGITTEKALFILYGDGDNGKSTMLWTIRNIIDEYSQQILADTLMTKFESNNSQADLADLCGARFVITSETEGGQRLSASKLKRTSQGTGKIKSARKYENPIAFAETHKLWIDTNLRPTVGDVDDKALLARLHLIAFLVSIPKDRIDRSLSAKLLTEAEGILAWLIEGARLWHLNGLDRPPEIDAARKEWIEEMDHVGHYINERCETGEAYQVQAGVLYRDYQQWSLERGEKETLSHTKFGMRLGGREFKKRHTVAGAVYVGIGLRRNDRESVAESADEFDGSCNKTVQ